MRILVRAELVQGRRIKQWVFYRRNEERIEALKQDLFAGL
jgi:ArsR family transcriptional regulator